MNWYVASRVRHKEYLREVSEKLKGLGETVTSDWLYQDSLKPYEENDVAVKALSESVVQAVLASDVFVLISDPEGTDMFVELGIALSSLRTRIYIVGEFGRRSLMQLHPSITHVPTLEDVFERERVKVEK